MSHREHLRSVHQRPQIHGLDGSYRSAVAYVLGCDAGTSGVMLAGFREWLIVRLDAGNNLGWPGLVLRAVAAEGRMADSASAGEEDDRLRRDGLFQLLDEFFERRDERDGLVRICHRYGEWLEGQSWYRPELLD